MPKLSNGIEYANSHLQETFAEYLLSNNFEIQPGEKNIVFYKPGMKVFITGLSLDLLLFNSVSKDWDYTAGFCGLDQIDIYGFILLLHSMKIQNVTEFPKNSYMISSQHGREADIIIQWLRRSLQPGINESISL